MVLGSNLKVNFTFTKDIVMIGCNKHMLIRRSSVIKMHFRNIGRVLECCKVQHSSVSTLAMQDSF